MYKFNLFNPFLFVHWFISGIIITISTYILSILGMVVFSPDFMMLIFGFGVFISSFVTANFARNLKSRGYKKCSYLAWVVCFLKFIVFMILILGTLSITGIIPMQF